MPAFTLAGPEAETAGLRRQLEAALRRAPSPASALRELVEAGREAAEATGEGGDARLAEASALGPGPDSPAGSCLVCREHFAEQGGKAVSAATGAVGGAGAAAPVCCESCNSQFHADCLSRWLRGLAGSHRAFGAVMGPCPYCSARVTCTA